MATLSPPPMGGSVKGGDDGGLMAAVSKVDATKVTTLLESGIEMDEATTNAAFWAVVKAVDRAEAQDQPLSADVPKMLHHIFDADLRHLLSREKQTTNVTCMKPALEGEEGAQERMNYIFDDSTHKDIKLAEGRRCEDGHCCDACSRNVFPTFATESESNFDTFPELASFTFNDLETVAAGTIIQFVRLVERVRRTIAHEYGLPLSTLLPLQAYSRKYVAGTTQQGGGGGEGDDVILHTDESTHAGYHYSSVLYLNTQGEDFEGGNFVFNDPVEEEEDADRETVQDRRAREAAEAVARFKAAEEGLEVEGEGADHEEFEDVNTMAEEMRRAGRKLTPFHPSRGAAVIFSSGWENMHEVDKITSGTRYAGEQNANEMK